MKSTVGGNRNLMTQSHLIGHTSLTTLKDNTLHLGLYLVGILSTSGMVLLRSLSFPHCLKRSPDITLWVILCLLLYKPLTRAQTFMDINGIWALFNYRLFNSSYALLKWQRGL